MQTSLNDRLLGMIDAGPGRVRELAPIFETACYPVGHGSQDGCLRRLATGCLAPHLVSPDCSPSADARPDLRCRPETAIKGRLDTPATIGQRTHRRRIVHEGQTENASPQNGPAPVQSFGPKPLAFLGLSGLHAAAEKVVLGRVSGERFEGSVQSRISQLGRQLATIRNLNLRSLLCSPVRSPEDQTRERG
jgi:hypothetical protein